MWGPPHISVLQVEHQVSLCVALVQVLGEDFHWVLSGTQWEAVVQPKSGLGMRPVGLPPQLPHTAAAQRHCPPRGVSIPQREATALGPWLPSPFHADPPVLDLACVSGMEVTEARREAPVLQCPLAGNNVAFPWRATAPPQLLASCARLAWATGFSRPLPSSGWREIWASRTRRGRGLGKGCAGNQQLVLSWDGLSKGWDMRESC